MTFLQHPISDDPNDQLLLQIQGAIAAYERAVMGERFRRGKLQKACEGNYQCGRAPYGYRYVPRHDTASGHLVVDEAEAELVRMIYGWLTDEQMTIRQILERLNAGPHFPRSGRHPWSPSVVHHILAGPVYAGTAYANRYTFVPPKKPRRDRGPRSHEASCRQPKPRELWIAISVPAPVEADTWDRAQMQLARNAALSFRNNTRYNYLLRCLLTCRTCGLAMYGRTCKATASQPERRYYQCHGKDCILTARPARCPSRNVKAVEIEAAVWDHVAGLLADPARLVAQFAHFADLEAGSDRERAADQLLRTRLDRTNRADKQAILQLVIERIIVGDGSLEIRHVIPLSPGQPNGSGAPTPKSRLRSDGVNPAPLPCCTDHPGDRRLQPFMRIRDDQLHAFQAALDQALEESRPERLGFRRADVQADDLAVPLDIAGHGDYRRYGHDPAALALAQVGCVQPEIRPFAGERPVEESADPFVDVLAELRDG